jgi:hypothetical protein
MDNTQSESSYGLFWNLNYNEKPKVYEFNGEYVKFTQFEFIAKTKQEVLDHANTLGFTEFDTNQSIYFILPNGNSLANIRRSGSSALSTLIANTFFSDKIPTDNNLHINTVIPIDSQPIGQAHAVLRNPIDRFISAYAKKVGGVPKDLSVDDFITWLEKQDKGLLNWHYRPQSIIVGNFENIKYYDFAKGLDDVALNIGLPTPVDTVNETDPKNKPTLTDEQINRLSVYYSDDLTLYSSITSSI